MRKRSKWDMFVEADKEVRTAAFDLTYLLNKYLAFPEPKTLKEIVEHGESYAYWFYEVRKLAQEIGQELRKKKAKKRG